MVLLLPACGAASLGAVQRKDSTLEHAIYRRDLMQKIQGIPDALRSIFDTNADYIKKPVQFLSFGKIKLGDDKNKSD